MTLVSALCPHCDAQLEVDPQLEAAICRSCHNAFITEKAIEKYNTVKGSAAESLPEAPPVVEPPENSSIHVAEKLMEARDYAAAEELFQALTVEEPHNYKGWLGLMRVRSDDFRDPNISKATYEVLEDFFKKACAAATNSRQLDDILAGYRPYRARVRDHLNAQAAEIDNQIRQMNAEMTRQTKEFNKDRINMESLIASMSKRRRRVFCLRAPVIILSILLAVGATGAAYMYAGKASVIPAACFASSFALVFGYLMCKLTDLPFRKKAKHLENGIENMRKRLDVREEVYEEEKNANENKIKYLKEQLEKTQVN